MQLLYICLEVLRNTTNYLTIYEEYTDQDLKRAPHEYKSDRLKLEPTYCDVLFDVLLLGLIEKSNYPTKQKLRIAASTGSSR